MPSSRFTRASLLAVLSVVSPFPSALAVGLCVPFPSDNRSWGKESSEKEGKLNPTLVCGFVLWFRYGNLVTGLVLNTSLLTGFPRDLTSGMFQGFPKLLKSLEETGP